MSKSILVNKISQRSHWKIHKNWAQFCIITPNFRIFMGSFFFYIYFNDIFLPYSLMFQRQDVISQTQNIYRNLSYSQTRLRGHILCMWLWQPGVGSLQTLLALQLADKETEWFIMIIILSYPIISVYMPRLYVLN